MCVSGVCSLGWWSRHSGSLLLLSCQFQRDFNFYFSEDALQVTLQTHVTNEVII